MSQQFDAIIIGAGQSGPFLAAKMAEAGSKVALIEREHLGGTCVNDGCTPTKSLVASARAAHMARRAADFGVNAGNVTVDMKAVKARKDTIVGASVSSLTDWLGNLDNLTLFWGEAGFLSANEVSVNGKTLTAPKIFINSGGRPAVPDWPGLSEITYLDNTSMMDLDVVPDHLIIAGASYVGLEFAQMYARFGARVTVFSNGDRPIAREDDDISEAVREILEAEGIQFLFNTSGVKLSKSENGVEIVLKVAGKSQKLSGSHLLIATGRLPNTEALNLIAAGIATNRRGFIEVDDHLRTNVPGIWAMGDVNGRGAFTHTSYNDFEIVADNLLEDGNRDIGVRIPIYALFIDPPLGRIGMSETDVRKSGKPALMATMPMAKVARARERSETQGLLKVLVDAETKQVLGGAFLGIEGDEVIHGLLQLMAGKQPYTVMQHAVHIHPTVSELIPTLLGTLTPLE
ncbi:FAD-containing oxidoreductase [Devosia rhodophyticola]|uniref:FAD-containing oxidoreductase n=1 Tax=Devosia rhodophyticola TaxID=3026423 RepID=A0ABY7YZI9_9HYPH|nr:FAD-containing oxidoreductase [Devosia rhodophyticola]WDR06746.1 FAD-containing oxidoreductase [Devosia rhodophyticola]